MMDCKNALVETGGDEEKAIEILRRKGLSRIEKRAGREAKEGLVQAYISTSGKRGVLVEVDCETDFVAKTDDFRRLVTLIAQKTTDANPAPNSNDEILSLKAEGQTIQQIFTDTASRLGENLIFRRFCRLEIPASAHGLIDWYIHTGSKLGVILMLETGNSATTTQADFRSLMREILLHIAHSNPMAIGRGEIPAELIAKEKAIYQGQIEAEGKKKPAEVVEKIITGKLEKFYAEVALLEQASVKTPEKSIGSLIADTAQKIGDTIILKSFCRFKIGE